MFKLSLKYTVILAICLLAGVNDIRAQEEIHSIKTLPRNYLIKVKQLSEFIDRFNFQKDFLNQDVGPEFESIITRNDYIRLLFNDEDERLDPEVENESYKNLVNKFIHEVCSDSIFIDPFSEQIYAELTCQINLDGKSEELDMLLRREIDNGLKWAIISVDRNFEREAELQWNKYDDKDPGNTPKSYIPPLSNETNFIDLKILLNNPENLDHLSSGDCVKENVLGFYNMIRKGALKYQHVKSIQYHILDIPGWIVVITNFHRNTDNSGWLISNLILKDDFSTYFREKYNYSPAGIFNEQ